MKKSEKFLIFFVKTLDKEEKMLYNTPPQTQRA